MFGLIVALAAQAIVETTPSLDSMSIASLVLGTCTTTPLQPASIRVSWTATGFNSSTQDYRVYRDGVLMSTQDTTAYTLQLAGLVENDTHNGQDITFNYRVDIVRTSDSAVLVTRSASVTKHYGNCV